MTAALETRLNERISELVRDFGGGPKFATLCEVSQSAVGKWQKPGADLKLSNLLKIVQKTGVSIIWLATGLGPKTPDERIRHAILGRAFENALLDVDRKTRQRIIDLLKLEVIIDGRAAIANPNTPIDPAL